MNKWAMLTNLEVFGLTLGFFLIGMGIGMIFGELKIEKMKQNDISKM